MASLLVGYMTTAMRPPRASPSRKIHGASRDHYASVEALELEVAAWVVVGETSAGLLGVVGWGRHDRGREADPAPLPGVSGKQGGGHREGPLADHQTGLARFQSVHE